MTSSGSNFYAMKHGHKVVTKLFIRKYDRHGKMNIDYIRKDNNKKRAYKLMYVYDV